LRVVLGGIDAEGLRLAKGAESSLYRITDDRLSDLPRDVFAYRAKQLASFEPESVRVLQLEFAGDTEADERSFEILEEDGVWRSGNVAIAEGEAVLWLGVLSRLTASEVVAEAVGPDELAGLGLAPPRLAIRVIGTPSDGAADASVLGEIHLGVSDPERGIVARRADRDLIYRIEPGLEDRLPLTPDAVEAAYRRDAPSESDPESAPDSDGDPDAGAVEDG
jgi:hypothetical protein